jgi:hypothetical protein
MVGAIGGVLEQRRRDLSESFGPVGTGEQRVVAEHRVVEQAFRARQGRLRRPWT